MESEQPDLGDSGPSIYPLNEQESSSPRNNTSVSAADSPTEMPNDLWQRIRDGFVLTGQDHRFVKPYIAWYAKHQAYLDRVAERARPFLYDIVEEIEARGMPMEIALLPVVESAFQPFAYSPGRAAGIWQFIPGTGKIYGLKQNWWYDGRRDVPEATKAALKYLTRLHKRFDGDWLLALASYNSGEGRVSRAIKKNKRKGLPIDFWSLDLPAETKGYVPKLLAISAIVANSKNHNITLASIPDEPYLERIDIGSQIDLALAAELANLPIETIYKLNPAFNRWATDPKGPHKLSLPIDKAEGFLGALAKVNKKNRIKWERHRIRQGETLGQIALKFQTTVELLQDVNNLRDKWIRAGKSIIIPVATKNLKHYLSEDQRRLTLQRTNRRGIKVKHTVRPGDTFWDISRKYKVKVGQLASWNGMSPRDSLMPGQKLVIWAKNRSIASSRYAAPPSSATRQRLHYRVRKGDSLARIAQKFSVTISKLRRWNSLPKGKYLQPGQRLTLYVDVTRQS
jgi:membrane-bound lytic murein transglycosylase D